MPQPAGTARSPAVTEPRFPSQSEEEDAVEVEGWRPARQPYWWRRKEFNATPSSIRPTTKRQSHSATSISNLSVSLNGKCFHYLGRDHLVADCRDPVKCFYYRRSGHKARQCPQRSRTAQPTPPPPPPPLNATKCPPLQQPAMARQGDPATRLGEAFAVASATHNMERKLECLSANAVIAWLCKGRGQH